MNLVGAPTYVLLAPGEIPLSRGPIQIFLIVIELFYLQDGFEKLVSILSNLSDLGHHLLISRI